MKIRCNRDALAGAFALAAAASGGKVKEILSNVKMVVDATYSHAVLMGTDTEVGVRAELSNVECDESGAVLLPVPPVSQILRDAEGDTIEIEDAGTETVIRTANAEFNLPSADPMQFPSINPFEEDAWFTVSSKLFSDIVARTSYSTDVSSTKYAIGGVNLEFERDKLTAVATDGRRLALQSGAITSTGDVVEGAAIVPIKPLQLIARNLGGSDVDVAVRGNELLVRAERYTIWCRLLEGRFPTWRKVIPSDIDRFESIEIDPSQMLSVIKQAAIVADTESRGIVFEVTGGRLRLSARTAMKGSSKIEMPIIYNGPSIELRLDYRFVSDFVRTVASGDELTLQVMSATQAAVMKTGDGALYVVMPMADK